MTRYNRKCTDCGKIYSIRRNKKCPYCDGIVTDMLTGGQNE